MRRDGAEGIRLLLEGKGGKGEELVWLCLSLL